VDNEYQAEQPASLSHACILFIPTASAGMLVDLLMCLIPVFRVLPGRTVIGEQKGRSTFLSI